MCLGCVFALIIMLSPRLGIALLWIFTDYVQRAFEGWVLPLLGLIFLPWTTLMYLLVAAPIGSISFWGWLFVGLGVILDISGYAQSAANRRYPQEQYEARFGSGATATAS
jgi:hypothetical protein